MEGIEDKMLLDLADDIGEGAKIKKLAVELGFKMGAAGRFEKMNTIGDDVSTKGTLKLLEDWRERTRKADQQRVMKRALKESGFENIADEYFSHPNKRARLEETSVPGSSSSAPTRELEPDIDGSYTPSKIAPAKYDPTLYPPESTYETWKSAEKGLVYILNNYNFPNRTKGKERLGSNEDIANIQHVFSELGYTPKVHYDLSRDEILESIDEIVSEINIEPDKHSSLCLVLMSHGNKDGIAGTDERIVTIDEIKEKLSARNCTALRGKPKLLFIQACRGGAFTRSAIEVDHECSEQGTSSHVEVDLVTLNFTGAAMPSVDVDGEGDQDVPENTDIFVANATSSGYFSLRDPEKGTWFIQALSEVFLLHANVDELHELMRKVTVRVTEGFDFRTRTEKLRLMMPSMEVRQTPAYEIQGMRKRFYFFPKYPDLAFDGPADSVVKSSSSSKADKQGELEGSSEKRPSGSASDNEVSERELRMLVDELGDHEDVGNLADELGFRNAKWQAYKRMNKDGEFEGTRKMLFDWKKKTSKKEQRSILRKAFEKTHFTEAAESL